MQPQRLPITELRPAAESRLHQYSLARGIATQISNDEASRTGAERKSSLETEVSQEIERTWRGAKHGGLFVPWNLPHRQSPNIQRRTSNRSGLDSGTATAGQELVYTEPGTFIEMLYNQMRIKQLGARTIAGLRDNVSYPKQTGKATGAWVEENPGGDVSDSSLTLGSIASSPKTYQSSSSISRQLLAQSIFDVETMVREDLARDAALALDSVAILGGGSDQPSGIGVTAGVQSYTALADVGNGGVLTYDDVVIMSQKLEDANVDTIADGGWLTTPGIKSTLKRTARLGNLVGLPIWADDDTVDGFKAASSNQVAKNGSKGTSSGTLHTIIRGIFETMVIGLWGRGFELVIDPYRLKKQGMVELTSYMLTDVTLLYPAAFVVAKFISTI